MSDPKPIILNTDPAAASFKTGLQGWVSRNGHFFGDGPEAEKLARLDGCTHSLCEKCGAVTEKYYTACDACRDKRAAERHAAREKKPWDGKAMIYSHTHDKFFSEPLEAQDYCMDNDLAPVDMQLVLCDPVYPGTVDPLEYYADDLPEDADESFLPMELRAAFDALNMAVERCRVPLSWEPGKFALDLDAGEEG